jgi:hypothetical protein
MVYTKTGYEMYRYFANIEVQGFISTDPNQKYYLPDGQTFTSIDNVEDWFIRVAKQIESERQKIIMNAVANKE